MSTENKIAFIAVTQNGKDLAINIKKILGEGDIYITDKLSNKTNKEIYKIIEGRLSDFTAKLFKEYDLNAVILDCTIDNNFITFLEYKESGVRFKRIDSDLSDVLKDKDEEKDEKADEEIVNFFKEKIGDRVQKYSVESLKKEDTPAVILISEESRRMMEMQSRFAGLDYGFDLKEEKTLVINDRNPLIKKVLSLRDDETKKEAVDVICNQIVDLALLANKELGAEELDLFIKRSNELMSKVISL